MTTALVTRPKDDSVPLCDALCRRGLDVLVEPLLDIVPVQGASVDATGMQAILATSANGVRALARAWPGRDLPVLAVGDASARMARDLGFARVESAGGDAHALVDLVCRRLRPVDGGLLHAAGTVTAGDLSARLVDAGFVVRRQVLYQARPARTAGPGLCRALAAGRLDLALFFSPRTAATFVRLVDDIRQGDDVGTMVAYALSATVARELESLSWAAIRVAGEPNQASLLAALDHDLTGAPGAGRNV